ncbi:MAG TPA: alpha/beta fold hydrolase, partial [Myxococcota bacterium]
FERVVVGNTSAADLSKPWERFSTSLLLRLPRVLTADAIDRERTILQITSNRSAVDNEPLARTWADYYREQTPTRSAFARQLFAASRSRLPRSITAPVLVLTSTGDRLVSHRCSENIARALSAPICVHDQAGHDLTLDAPDWVCDKVACSL